MTPRTDMVCLHVTTPLPEVVRFVIDSAHTRIPVYDKNRDDVVGILYVRDLLPELAMPPESRQRPLAEIARQPNFVPESKPVDALLQEFQRNRNHMAIVLDEYGGVSGLVTIEDVVEQIVGEIADEYDESEGAKILKQDERRYLVNGLTPVADFNQYFKADLPLDEFDTIGGLVVHRFGHMPRRGESVRIERFGFNVQRADTRRVHQLQVTVTPEA
jgi:magnesium and cobalt transporter